MGSQPIRKLLQEIAQEIAREKCSGHCSVEIAWAIAWESTWEIAWEIAWEMEERTKLFKKDSDWWKSSIYNGVMGSQPIRKLLGKLLLGKVLRKLLGKWRRGQSYLRKTVIGGKVAFRMG